MFIEIRQDRVQLCGYDRCAAALIHVFAHWTDWRLNESKLKNKETEPWIFLSKRQLRVDLMGIFGEPSIDRGISVLKSLGILSHREPDYIGQATWYLFDYKKANTLLASVVETDDLLIPKMPNRRSGFLAQKKLASAIMPLGINAEGLGINAEGASALMPSINKTLKQDTEQKPPIPPPSETSTGGVPPPESVPKTSTGCDSKLADLASESAKKILAIHPSRKCTTKVAAKLLVTILTKSKIELADAPNYLADIVRRHAGWCASPDWTKDNSQYCPGLAKWLNWSQERYLVDPPAGREQPQINRRLLL